MRGVGCGDGELYFEFNMGPANAAIATEAYVEAWRGFAHRFSRAKRDAVPPKLDLKTTKQNIIRNRSISFELSVELKVWTEVVIFQMLAGRVPSNDGAMRGIFQESGVPRAAVGVRWR